MQNKKSLIIIITIVSLVILVFLGYLVSKKILINNNDNKGDSNNKFSIETESGRVEVLGYATLEKVNEADCYTDNCNKYDYVFFNILESESEDFLTYIENLNGNTFVSNQNIGLGCFSNNILNYYNHSDEFGMKSFTLTKDETSKIMNSTKENPIKLELEKSKLTGGIGAPNCYSHITNIKVIE